MSSHREAPEISKDPVADNTDVYAFVNKDNASVTLIANFLPFQNPYGGPNFFEFGDDVLYEIHVCNSGDGVADVTYQFRFTTTIRNKNTFLYNTGRINHITDTTFNRPQTYSVTRVPRKGRAEVLASGLTVPPCNVGFRSTPNYAHFTDEAVHPLKGGCKVFAGQRSDAFHADLGSIFDLGALRPFNHLHLIPSADAMGVNGLQALNVHSIAIQVPKTDLTSDGSKPTDVSSPKSVIGVYASASRQKTRIFNAKAAKFVGYGPFEQVSRLANPLFNEVIVPMARKDEWNASEPADDKNFAQYVAKPELGALLPVLYPGVFPHLAAYTKPRADLLAILLTGIPAGVVRGFPGNYTGSTQADLLRLNMAIPPASNPNDLGLLGGDIAGFPNGRRVTDDVVTIELRAIAGVTIPFVDSYTPDGAASGVTDGTTNTNLPVLDHFPYLGTPAGGYETKPGIPATS